jgi:transposase
VFDKFHISCAIKGQRYTLLSNRENLTMDGRQALKKLLAANKRLNTAYLLKESFATAATAASALRSRRVAVPEVRRGDAPRSAKLAT